jgi:sugar (pentulose or hexulose) kinase
MAEALRAVANVLEKPQSSAQGQGGGTQEGRNAVSAAGSLGAEIVAAPLEVAAAAIGAAGEVVTSALGGSPDEERGNNASRKGGRRSSARRKSSADGD